MRMYVCHSREKSPFEAFQVARPSRFLYIIRPDSVIAHETKYAITPMSVKKVDFKNFIVDLLIGVRHD